MGWEEWLFSFVLIICPLYSLPCFVNGGSREVVTITDLKGLSGKDYREKLVPERAGETGKEWITLEVTIAY